jgi:hypothetical protein
MRAAGRVRHRHGILACVILALAGCAAEPVPPDPLPLPPTPPRRAQAVRPAVPPQRPPPAAETAPEAEPAAAASPAAAPAGGGWRVVRDGTLGCEDPAPLRLLRQGSDSVPRLLAEARASGGCRTTFRVNDWAFEASAAELVRLRLLNGPPMTLWFLRDDVRAP